MREISHRSSSPHQERGEFRPSHARSKQNTARSKRAGNLGRLGDVLGTDLLAAALGLTDEALRILIEGRDHAREEQYAAHLAARFKEAGIPASWLDRPYSPLGPDQLHTLRAHAAAASNKAPIRRANFRRIVAAFDGREEVLADALEMVPSAVTNVAEGRLEFDDGRFGHTNPRLMKAGFPDGWLEQAEPELPDDLLQSLEQLATDDYERTFEEGQQAQAQAFVSPPAPPAQAQRSLPGAAPIDKTQETAMASTPQRPSKAATPQQPASAPRQFAAAGMPNATKPMAHPSTGGAAKLPRSVMAAGRKLSGAAAKTSAAKTPSAPATAPQPAAALAQTSAATAPVQSKKAGGTATPAPTPAAQPAERRPSAPRSNVPKDVSKARAEALEQLLSGDNVRRGAKVTLWRDILGSSLPFWGNIRRGAVSFRDDLAAGAVAALELPEGWLDNPTFPPATLAAWVTDPKAPVPPPMKLGDGTADSEGADTAGDSGAGAADNGQQTLPLAADDAAASASVQGAAGSAQGAAERPVRPFTHRKTPQTPKVTMSKAPSGPPVMPGTAAKSSAAGKAGAKSAGAGAAKAAGAGPAAAAGAGAATDTATNTGGQQSAGFEAVDARQHYGEQFAAEAAGAAADQAAGQAPAAQRAAAPAPGPTPAPAASAPATAATGTAAVAAPAVRQAGPLVQALLSLINAKTSSGELTEDMALDLINKLMGH